MSLESKNDQIKRETLALYEQLPQNREARIARKDIRDKIIELNYSFFGYIAKKTFINNSSVTYEDKVQSALCHFCECWWWYKWKGDDTHPGYRQDLSFTVFFGPRVGEMIERELNEVKYSIRRSLCMEAGKQLGKHWGQVKYEDLSRVQLDGDKMDSLKAIFGSMYWADLDTHAMFIGSKENIPSILDQLSDKYDSLSQLLIHEMIDEERRLTDDDLVRMADMYSVPYQSLHKLLPEAENTLYRMLKDHVDISDTFE